MIDATSNESATAVADPTPSAVTHPEWCQLGPECVAADPATDHLLQHYSRPAIWQLTSCDVEVIVRRSRWDNLEDGRQDTTSAEEVILSLRDLTSVTLDGAPIFADAHMGQEEIEWLIRVLSRQLERFRGRKAYEFPEQDMGGGVPPVIVLDNGRGVRPAPRMAKVLEAFFADTPATSGDDTEHDEDGGITQ